MLGVLRKQGFTPSPPGLIHAATRLAQRAYGSRRRRPLDRASATEVGLAGATVAVPRLAIAGRRGLFPLGER